jgi:hypothetical protein
MGPPRFVLTFAISRGGVPTRTIAAPGAPRYRVSYQYDDLGHRIAQSVEGRTDDGSPWLPAQRRAFLFDGWSVTLR